MELVSRIENARRLIREGRLANEASVSAGVVLPLLNGLGWDVFDPSVVAPEYGVGGRRVDFALLHHGRPIVFVEVKQPGHGVGADRQLFEYAFHEGVPLAVLTDGATWHLYLPAMQGTYDERRVYLLDLLERDPAESAERLMRYLDCEAVASGEAFDRARQDYQRSRQRREAREAIPSAWQAMIEEGNERLVEVIVAEVESRSGFRPEPEDIVGFLSGLSVHQGIPPKRSPPRPSLPTPPKPTVQEPAPTSPGGVPGVGFVLNGTFEPARNGRDVVIRVFRALSKRDPSFLARFAARPKHGRKRRYLSRDRAELFPGQPDLVDQSVEVGDGYWLMLHASHGMLESIVKLASEEAGLVFGRDLKVRMK